MDIARPKMTDSPWFWAYLFTTFGLIALAVINPKFTARQTQIERQYLGRQHSSPNVSEEHSSGDLLNDGATIITLQPLFFALAAISTTAWIIFWRRRVARRTG